MSKAFEDKIEELGQITNIQSLMDEALRFVADGDDTAKFFSIAMKAHNRAEGRMGNKNGASAPHEDPENVVKALITQHGDFLKVKHHFPEMSKDSAATIISANAASQASSGKGEPSIGG